MASTKRKVNHNSLPIKTMAARKTKKKAAAKSKQLAAPPADESPANNGDVTEEESIHNDADDMEEDANDIPDTANQDTIAGEEINDIQTKPTKNKKKSQEEPSIIIPFLDTFYQLSSDETKLRSIAARDLITHCFFSPTNDNNDSGDSVNASDAAYALTRLMNGLCTGRAASRQGYASALSMFMRISHSSKGEDKKTALSAILEVDTFGKDRMNQDEDAASVFRYKLLGATSFQQKDKGSGTKMKGMEERDHAFGRLFGILAVVRSGVLGLKDFPLEVCHIIQYLIDCCVL